MNATVHFRESPNVFARAVEPSYAIAPDHISDLSDVWIEECDPQNECGAICTGFFFAGDAIGSNERHEDVAVRTLTLEGAALETADGTEYLPRDSLIAMWGMDTIWRVECAEMEAL